MTLEEVKRICKSLELSNFKRTIRQDIEEFKKSEGAIIMRDYILGMIGILILLKIWEIILL